MIVKSADVSFSAGAVQDAIGATGSKMTAII
jgi:hypothetical protein